MLINLPQEVILVIARNLEFEDKLGLVLTCRVLQKLILSTLLYEELSFYRRQDALLSALEYFESKPAYRPQVRRINTGCLFVTDEGLRRIPIAFPKVSEFTARGIASQQDQPDLEQMVNWKDTLERCDVPFKLQQLLCLLTNNTFSHLTWLSMEMDPFIVPDAVSNWNSFDCLKNVPLLNDLRLARGMITFEALEKIHSVCPQLKSLTLSHMWFLTPSNDTLPPSISPATSLLSLTMGSDTCIEGRTCTILDYITAKYTQLVELEVLSEWAHIADRDDDSDDSLDSLDSFDSFDDSSDGFFISFGNNNPDIDDDVYYRRGDDFLSNLPATIKTLKINTGLFKDPIASLEKTAINPKELTFRAYNNRGIYPAEVVKRQNHIDYIKRLDQLKTLTIGFQCNMRNRNGTVVFGNITHLTAMILDDYMFCIFNIDQLFLTFPSLTSLTIHQGSHPLTASSASIEETYPNFRKLAIKSCNLDQSVVDFVRTALPNIKELDLPIYRQKHVNGHMWCFDQDSGCDCILNDWTGRRNTKCHFGSDLCINLSGCMLDVFNLSTQRVDTPFYLEVQTQKKYNKYTLKRNSNRRYYLGSTRPDEIIQGSNVVKITCDGIKRFMIRGEDVKFSFFDV